MASEPGSLGNIGLRDYMERMLDERDRLWQARHDALALALDLQAKEYARRLEELNHAHAEAQRVLNTYVPREVYEKSEAELHKTAGELSNWKARTSADLAAINARLAAYLVGITVFFTVVSIALNIAFNLR